MTRIFFVLFFVGCIHSFAQQNQLLVWNNQFDVYASEYWLVKPLSSRAEVYQTQDKKILTFRG
jgi:hypothetical protein